MPEAENAILEAPESGQHDQRPDLAKQQHDLSLLRKMALRGTLAFGTLSGFLSACLPSGHETVAKTQIPTIKPGVDVVSATPTMPSATAKIEATKTAKPTETPEAVKTPEATQRNYTVEAAPGLPSVSREAGRTIEQDSAAVQGVLDTFPQIGKATVVLVDTGHSHWDKNILYLNRNLYSIEALKFEAAHEMSHYLDVEFNGDILSQYLTPDQMQKLRDLRQKALEDPVWGSNYTLAGILDPIKSTVLNDIIENKYTDVQAAAATNIFPDSVFVSGQRHPDIPGPEPFRDLLPSINQITALAQNTQKANYTDIAGFLDSEQTKIAQISAVDPIMKHVFEVEQQNKNSLQGLNTMWSSQIDKNAWLTGPYTGNYWQGQLNMADVILINDFLNSDQDVINLFPPEKIAEIKTLIDLRIQNADEEKFAELGKTTNAGRQTSLSLYFAKLREFAKATVLVVPESVAQTPQFAALMESTPTATESGQKVIVAFKKEDSQ